MAMLQMQRILICALKKDRKSIMELLQRRGVVEISDNYPEDSVFHKSDISAASNVLEKSISTAGEAIEILNSYSNEKKSVLSPLHGLKEVSLEDYRAFKEKHDLILHTAERVIALSKEIAETKAEILKLNTQIEILTPWIDLDIPISFSETKSTRVFIGTLPKQWTLEAIYEKLADFMPVNVDIISSSKNQTCIFVICRKENADSVFEALREQEFSLPGISYDLAPAEQLKELNNQIAKAEKAISGAVKEIEAFTEQKEDIKFLQDYNSMRLEKYEAIGHLLQSRNTFVMSGYIAKKYSGPLLAELNNSYLLEVEFDTPGEDEDVPVLLKNNAFSQPLEGIVNSYSPPRRDEVDPTMVMSLFYYLLFGLMLGDAGYGAIMVIACGFGLLKFGRRMERSMKNTLRMFFFCGLSTLFWGIVFSSYFGDIVDVVSENYFGHKLSIPPLWFLPLNEPMRLLTFSMTLGIIHLFTGLGLKLYMLLRQRNYKAIIYDVLLWYILLISSIILLLSMQMMSDMLGISLAVPSSVANAAKILAVLASVGIILTNGRESKNPFKRILKGLYALYGISGYLSDVLSYSRLLALGLATSVVATVINKLAVMAGSGLLGPVIFTVIAILGHTLNISINALGAYVHTNRLQYVEFFGKFYEGGGRLFSPFSNKTKYYKIKEKTNYEN